MTEHCPSESESTRSGGTFVRSLERGLAVIRAFDREHARMTVSEVARRAGVTRAAARRLLHTLVSLGYARTDGKTFELAPRVLELGYAYLSSFGIAEVAQTYMDALSRSLAESCSLAVLDGAEIVYVARVPTQRIMSQSLGGGHAPAGLSHLDGTGPAGGAAPGGARPPA